MSTDTTPKTQPTTVYERYLHTRELLALQKAPGERLHPDELAFQVVHQTFELWWKLTGELFTRAMDDLAAGEFLGAARLIRRAVDAQHVVMAALRQLEFVAPVDFLEIRKGLEDGSGGESPGWRMILRQAPRLWDAFEGAVAKAGTTVNGVYADPASHLALYECAEALTDFDEIFHLFRAQHLKLAQRHVGLKSTGTGGMPMEALERTLHDLLWPALWNARDNLVNAAIDAGASYGKATPGRS